jgi:hypothetical protein
MKMITIVLTFMLTLPALSVTFNSGTSIFSPISVQDTLKERQILYNGLLWTNKYHKFDGDQYLFSDIFLPGSLYFNNHIFRDLDLRYDIVSDEIMIPQSLDVIVQLNKEMVDSFTLVFKKKEYRFINLREDSLLGSSGYLNVLYQGRSALYSKYIKTIATVITDKSNGYFNEIMQLILVLDEKAYKIRRLRDILKLIPSESERIRHFVREKRLKVSINNPDSFIPVIRYYDSLKN